MLFQTAQTAPMELAVITVIRDIIPLQMEGAHHVGLHVILAQMTDLVTPAKTQNV